MLCSICLQIIRGGIASLNKCDHSFCLSCILQWSKYSTTCPQDRGLFKKIFVKTKDGKILRPLNIQSPKKNINKDIDNHNNMDISCELCGNGDDTSFLICGECNLAYHNECLAEICTLPPASVYYEWICPVCDPSFSSVCS